MSTVDPAAPTASPRTPRPPTKQPDRPKTTFDPALIGLAWALATGPGRIPLLP